MPQRLQRSRARGWRMPKGTVYVGRPTRWGNPYRVGDDDERYPPGHVLMTRERAIDLYRRDLVCDDPMCVDLEHPYTRDLVPDLPLLRGVDLVCWCPPDVPCHADVLLDLANAPEVTL